MKPNILYIIAILAICACNKKEPANNNLDIIDAKKSMGVSATGDPNDILSFYSFIEGPSDGIFGLKCYNPQVSGGRPPRWDDDQSPLDFGGAFYDKQDNIIPGGDITFGPMNFYSDAQHGYFYDLTTYRSSTTRRASVSAMARTTPGYATVDYSTVGGTTQSISINPVPGAANLPNRGATGSLYIPQQVHIDWSKTQHFNARGNNIAKIGTISPDLDLYWPTDPGNDKGVVIIVEYDAELSSVISSVSPPAARKYYVAFRVPDNGKYTLKLADVWGLAYDATKAYVAYMTVTIGRANYATLNDRDGIAKYSIYAATASDFMLEMNIAKFHN